MVNFVIRRSSATLTAMNHHQANDNHRRAVIWDLDGTLINSVEYHWAAWRGTMAAEGISFTYEEFVSDFGKRNDEILRLRLRADLPNDEITRISLDKEQRYRALVRSQGIELLPGALHWLAQLKAAGWLQALGTSAPRGNIDAVFAATNIEQFFAAVMSSEEVKQGKPAPDVFLAAAQKVGVEPANCIVIEDAPAGIEAGRRAGMRTVGVLTTHAELEADDVFPALSDLPENFFEQSFRPTKA